MNHPRTLLLSFLLLPLVSATDYAQPTVFPVATNLTDQLLSELGGNAASDGTNFLVGILQAIRQFAWQHQFARRRAIDCP